MRLQQSYSSSNLDHRLWPATGGSEGGLESTTRETLLGTDGSPAELQVDQPPDNRPIEGPHCADNQLLWLSIIDNCRLNDSLLLLCARPRLQSVRPGATIPLPSLHREKGHSRGQSVSKEAALARISSSLGLGWACPLLGARTCRPPQTGLSHDPRALLGWQFPSQPGR